MIGEHKPRQRLHNGGSPARREHFLIASARLFAIFKTVSSLALIEAKRDGRPLTAAEIRQIISAYTDGRILDYQMAAFLMAVYFRGLSDDEVRALTLAMRDSGETLSFPRDPRPLVDKHSTGGVGDKVSLPLAPLLACLGFRVPMISGRGLGITGGTLDKLDSIPGFRTTLPAGRILQIVQAIGCVICGQTERMVPADKKMYALRDVTGTVPSIPLIVASILSKKLAENLDALVLDVKCGAAAFMPTRKKARALAQAMVRLGNDCGVNTRALITSMESPLGRAAGNWLEVKEAVECLDDRPAGHAVQPPPARRTRRSCAPVAPASPLSDLRELVLACAAQLLLQTGKAKTLADAGRRAELCLASGGPREKWNEMLEAQGADLNAFNRKLALDHAAPVVLELKTRESGYVSRCDARVLGETIRNLGGGRLTKESIIDHDVGVDRLAKPGDKIPAGAVLARIHAGDLAQARAARDQLKGAFQVSARPPLDEPLLLARIEYA
jgi:thymidine phosphorylase